MKMTMNMGTFEELSSHEMVVVDGGGIGKALGFVGGTVAFAWGSMITIVGVGTLNPGLALSGAELVGTGIGVICASL